MADSGTFFCAYCGEENHLPLDTGGARHQVLVEDCQVCCRPNDLLIEVDRQGAVSLRATPQ